MTTTYVDRELLPPRTPEQEEEHQRALQFATCLDLARSGDQAAARELGVNPEQLQQVGITCHAEPWERSRVWCGHAIGHTGRHVARDWWGSIWLEW